MGEMDEMYSISFHLFIAEINFRSLDNYIFTYNTNESGTTCPILKYNNCHK